MPRRAPGSDAPSADNERRKPRERISKLAAAAEPWPVDPSCSPPLTKHYCRWTPGVLSPRLQWPAASSTPIASRGPCSLATKRINCWAARSSSQRKNARNSCRVRTATPAAKAIGSIDLRLTSDSRPRMYSSRYVKVLWRAKQWQNCPSHLRQRRLQRSNLLWCHLQILQNVFS